MGLNYNFNLKSVSLSDSGSFFDCDGDVEDFFGDDYLSVNGFVIPIATNVQGICDSYNIFHNDTEISTDVVQQILNGYVEVSNVPSETFICLFDTVRGAQRVIYFKF